MPPSSANGERQGRQRPAAAAAARRASSRWTVSAAFEAPDRSPLRPALVLCIRNVGVVFALRSHGLSQRHQPTRPDPGVIAVVIAIHALLLFAVIHRWGRAASRNSTIIPAGQHPRLEAAAAPTTPAAAPASEAQGGRRAAPPRTSRARRRRSRRPSPRWSFRGFRKSRPARPRAEGTAPTQGAAPVAGPGTGTGGSGNGTGTRHRERLWRWRGGRRRRSAAPRRSGAHRPRLLARAARPWPRGATIFMRLRGRCAGLCPANARWTAARASRR